MENKKIIQEELDRIKLLFSYDTSYTLTENVELTEQKQLKSLFKSDAALAKTAARELDAAGMAGLKGGVKRMDGVVLNKADDIIKAVKTGKLAPAELGRVNAALLKNTKNPAVKTAVIQDVVGTSTFATKYGVKTESEAVVSLQTKGWTKADAKAAVTEYKNSGKSFKGKKPTGTGKGKGVNKKPPKKTRAKKGQGKIKSVPGKTNWKSFIKSIPGWYGRSRTLRWLVRIGGVYLAYKWFIESDSSAPFPDCIRKNIPEEDFIKMTNEEDNSVLISDTGIDAIDTIGGGRFYDNGDFKTGNLKYEGTWEDVPGTGVVITIAGNQYTMSCEGIVDDTEDEDEDDGNEDGVITYRNCSSVPFDLGCISKDIEMVQSCLEIKPVDGKLGPITKSGIKNAGYSVPLTQSDLDKIKEKCGGTTTTTTTIYTPERTNYETTDL